MFVTKLSFKFIFFQIVVDTPRDIPCCHILETSPVGSGATALANTVLTNMTQTFAEEVLQKTFTYLLLFLLLWFFLSQASDRPTVALFGSDSG